MALRNHQHKKPKPSPVQLAVAAVKQDGSVMNLSVEGFDPSPTALDLDLDLDLDDADENGICSKPHCSHRAVDACIICGQPLCGDCV